MLLGDWLANLDKHIPNLLANSTHISLSFTFLSSCVGTVLTSITSVFLVSPSHPHPPLLDIRVLAYSGTDDFVCNYYGGNAWTTALKWPQQQQFDAAPFTVHHPIFFNPSPGFRFLPTPSPSLAIHGERHPLRSVAHCRSVDIL